jgi:hypothetical protein
MKKLVTLLIIVLAFSTVNGQNRQVARSIKSDKKTETVDVSKRINQKKLEALTSAQQKEYLQKIQEGVNQQDKAAISFDQALKLRGTVKKVAVKTTHTAKKAPQKSTRSTTDDFFESFTGSTFPPTGWTLSGTPTVNWTNVAGYDAIQSGISALLTGYGDGSFAVFDGFFVNQPNQTGSLISPTITPTAGASTLKFEVIQVLLNYTYIDAGLKLYVDVQTGGSTWTNGTSNVLTQIQGYNTAGVTQNPTTIEISLAAYVGQNIKVRFRAISDWGAFTLLLDNVSLASPIAKDAELVEITSPTAGGSATATVSVKVINNGTETITSLPISYKVNDGTAVTETYTGSLATGASTTFTFSAKANLSAYGNYSIEAYTALPGDQKTSNDSKTVFIVYQLPVTLYGYRTYSNGPATEFVSFSSATPGTLTVKKVWSDGSNDVRGGEYINGVLSIYTAAGNPAAPKNVVKFNPEDFSVLSTAAYTGGVANDLTYDYSTSTLYAASSVLYTVNTSTNTYTQVGSLGKSFLGVAANLAGTLYGVATDGNLYSINKTTAAITLIGATGFTPNYIQSLAFDHNTGRLFWAFLNSSGSASNLIEIDPATGKGFNLGSLGATVTELLGLYIPYIANTGIPAAPTNLVVTPGADGALTASLAWVNPTLTLAGSPAVLTSVVVTRDGSIIATLAATATTYTDNSPTNGTHTYGVYGVNAAGNGLPISTSAFIGVDPCSIGITLPHSQGFENESAIACWTINDADGGGTTWELSTSQYHEGASSIYHNWAASSAGNQDGWLISPKIIVPAGASELSFWSYNQFPTDYVKNNVLVSTTGTATANFTEIWTPGSVVYPAAWVETKISLSAYAGQTIYLAFRYQGSYAHSWYLDDLKLKEIVGKDAGVTAIVQPVSGPNLTATETVKIKVKNFGADALSSVPVKLQIDGGTPISGTVPSIAVGEEVEYTFPVTIDLSAVKSYSIKAYTEQATDTDPSNDAITKAVINYGNIAVIGGATSVTSCDIKFVDDGITGNYSASSNETQTITFNPATPGSRIKADFTSFHSYPWELFFGYPFPGDTLYVYDGNAANPTKLLGFLTDDLTGNLPDAFRSSASDGSLTFVFIKQSYESAPGWEANISCYTPQAKDAGVNKILSPLAGGSAAAEVKVEIKNYGSDPITTTDVAYKLNGGAEVVGTFTGNIAAGATVQYTFTQKVDVSQYGSYTLEAYTKLAGDGDATNDSKSISFAYKESITLYGYRIWDDVVSDYTNAVSFESSNPSVVTKVSSYRDGANIIFSGEYIDDYIYVYTVLSSESGSTPKNFIKLTSNWTEVSRKAITEIPNDLAYDYSTETLYATTYNQTDGLSLKTVNLTTGALTLVAKITGIDYLFTLAVDLSGTLYGVDDDGILVTIDKTTGAATVKGSTGIAPNYIQSMAFDHNTERLFWEMSNTADAGKLIELDPATGVATDLGILGANAEIVGLYTPYSPNTAIEVDSTDPADKDTEVGFDADIVITFNQAVTSADLTGIKVSEYDVPANVIAVSSSVSGNKLTLTHAVDFASNTKYNVLVPSGAIAGYDADIVFWFITKKGLDIKDVKQGSITIYPNPSDGIIHISSLSANSSLSILDVAGRTIENYNLKGGNVTLNLNLKSGAYFVQINSNGEKSTHKLIIK